MAALDENSITRLVTVSSVDMGANATIYVTRTGKTMVPDHITVRSATAGATLAQNYNFGSLPSALGFAVGQSFAGLVTTSYFQKLRASNATVYFVVPAGTAFGMAAISGATGTTVSIDLFGHLV